MSIVSSQQSRGVWGFITGLPGAAPPERIPSARVRRVSFLLACLFVMGLIDLAFTLTYLNSVGMYELNPIARFLIVNGSWGHLVGFKLSTITISSIAIFTARRSALAEMAAWACAAMLAVLMAHWVQYTDSVNELTHNIALLSEHEHELGQAWLRYER